MSRCSARPQGVERFRTVALDVPPTPDLPAVRALLEHGDAEGRWDREEGCVTTAWAALGAAADD
ncbi:hypothetical protein PUR71_16475 [Streptomyces sp. SP17BM10]|uniref:hypothetical protein n=1 Tax=Streptomyces sp. SP17BM10 TaxID=3002530 RepID=UPI002E79EDD6|nr:hypothetical protein [Streptomyces sp. SP17BM10]MEE1784485.1 hypothetical protein [Streptomyces sp. SP17BM10]